MFVNKKCPVGTGSSEIKAALNCQQSWRAYQHNIAEQPTWIIIPEFYIFRTDFSFVKDKNLRIFPCASEF
jgi:hypothetical protein